MTLYTNLLYVFLMLVGLYKYTHDQYNYIDTHSEAVHNMQALELESEFFRVPSLLRGVEWVHLRPWLVLVSPCFRENIVATCKIGSCLCSFDHLPQENVIVLFFGNQISKWRSFEKKGYFLPTFHIF